MEEAAPTLRGLVATQPVCAQRFSQAEELSKALFNGEGGRVVLPYFTDHTLNHCRAVEKHLDRILFGSGMRSREAFEPTPEEAMYLLSAAWLHDLGMVYGIFPGEQSSDLHDSPGAGKYHRDRHELRTSTFLLDHWKLNCGWDHRELCYLANVCQYHRHHYPIEAFSPVHTDGKHCRSSVRLQVMAALLRLADACHVDASRAPGPLRALYDALGMPAESVRHWETLDLVTDVRFDHDDKRITLVAEIPPPHDIGMGTFDLLDLVDNVSRSVDKELEGIRAVLAPYPNISFAGVDNRVYRIDALAVESPRRCLALWPYLLHEPSRSATEAAAATVQLIILAVTAKPDFGPASRETIEGILAESLRFRPFDFLIRNLDYKVRAILSELASSPKALAEKLVLELTTFLEKMKTQTSAVACQAAAIVDPNDAIVLYGYSTSVARFLHNTRRTRNAPVYIVECLLPAEDSDLGLAENQRIAAKAQALGLDVRFVSLSGVSTVLADLTSRAASCKLLLGTHGVLKNGDMLCKVGTHSLVLTAREFGVKIIVFSDPEKVLRNGQDDEDVASAKSRIGQTRSHPILNDVLWHTPLMDRIPRALVHVVVQPAPVHARPGASGSADPGESKSSERESSPT